MDAVDKNRKKNTEVRRGTWIRGCAQRTGFVSEHARIASFVAAGIDQFPFFTLVERHITAGTNTWIWRRKILAVQ